MRYPVYEPIRHVLCINNVNNFDNEIRNVTK